jgi:hypothetical protein
MAGSCFASREANHIFGKQGSVVRLSVPIHGGQPAGHLMKLAGLSEEDLT